MGLFVVFEGIDGSGKSTLLEEVSRLLADLAPVILREPTSLPSGVKIREALASQNDRSQQEWLDLFLADRRANVEQNIQPALDQGKVILQDRYFYSTAAYQGASVSPDSRDRLSAAQIVKLHDSFPKPDLLFFLEIDPDESLKRILASRPNLEIFEKKERLGAIAAAYKTILPPSCIRLDALADSKLNAQLVEERVRRLAGRSKT